MTDSIDRLRRFLRELKRRNVYKVGVAYVAVAFVVLQGARLLVTALVLPEWFYRVGVALALLGFLLALVLIVALAGGVWYAKAGDGGKAGAEATATTDTAVRTAAFARSPSISENGIRSPTHTMG